MKKNKKLFAILTLVAFMRTLVPAFAFAGDTATVTAKITEEDKLQLTAQAMCLEEMFSTEISEGAIFYGETRRRENVLFSQELREEVKELFAEMHQYYSRGYTPKVKKSKSCNNCSLKELCLPKLEKTTSVAAYITQSLKEDVE